jgi:hypothetical protein
MNARTEPSTGDVSSLGEAWASQAVMQFRREWIAAGRPPAQEQATPKIRGAAADQGAGRLGDILHRTFFMSRQTS